MSTVRNFRGNAKGEAKDVICGSILPKSCSNLILLCKYSIERFLFDCRE